MFIISFKIYSICVILFLDGLFVLIKMKIPRDFQSAITPMVDAFPGCGVSKAQRNGTG